MSQPLSPACFHLEHGPAIDEVAFLDWLSPPPETAPPLAGGELGIPALEHEHRRFKQLLGALRHSLARGEPQKISTAIEALERFAAHHFATEERLLEAVYYPFLERHREDHQRLHNCLLELRQHHAKGSETLPMRVEQLAQGLDRHLRHEDRQCAPYLRHFAKRPWLARMCQALLRRPETAARER